jgi:PQQ-dependent dehydrogenase (methanol/ethanol family)
MVHKKRLVVFLCIWVGSLPSAWPLNGQIQDQLDDGQWTMPVKNFASTRYSTLAEINTANVRNLKLAWTFSTGLTRGHEAAPLIVNNTMYVVTPWPNLLYALDLTKPGGALKWTYSPHPSASAQGVACCDVVSRGAVYYNGKIYYNTLDVHTVAVDAKTGKEIWKTALGDINLGESMTMAPLVVKGKVLVGNSGGEFGVRGWLAALDAETGKVIWRAYATGPDRDVLIGPSFKPFYDQDRGKDLGVKTWQGEQWKIGGGAAWSWISYDPKLDLIYYGTSNPVRGTPSNAQGTTSGPVPFSLVVLTLGKQFGHTSSIPTTITTTTASTKTSCSI